MGVGFSALALSFGMAYGVIDAVREANDGKQLMLDNCMDDLSLHSVSVRPACHKRRFFPPDAQLYVVKHQVKHYDPPVYISTGNNNASGLMFPVGGGQYTETEVLLQGTFVIPPNEIHTKYDGNLGEKYTHERIINTYKKLEDFERDVKEFNTPIELPLIVEYSCPSQLWYLQDEKRHYVGSCKKTLVDAYLAKNRFPGARLIGTVSFLATTFIGLPYLISQVKK